MDDDLDGEIIWLNPVPPPSRRLIVKRGGHSITRQIPKPGIGDVVNFVNLLYLYHLQLQVLIFLETAG